MELLQETPCQRILLLTHTKRYWPALCIAGIQWSHIAKNDRALRGKTNIIRGDDNDEYKQVHAVVALYERRSHTGDGQRGIMQCNAMQCRPDCIHLTEMHSATDSQSVMQQHPRDALSWNQCAVHHHPIHCTARTLPQLKSCSALRCRAFRGLLDRFLVG